jgi:predicted RNA-binding protein
MPRANCLAGEFRWTVPLKSGDADLACRRPQWGKPKKENIMKLTKSGLELKEVIEKAMKDHVITNREYEDIMMAASNDGIADNHEQRLVGQLQGMLANGTLKKIPG